MKKNKYDITGLALMYYRESSGKNARRRFIKTLRSEGDLWTSLAHMNFSKFQRVFTPRQYDAIIDVFGSPDGNGTDFGYWSGT